MLGDPISARNATTATLSDGASASWLRQLVRLLVFSVFCVAVELGTRFCMDLMQNQRAFELQLHQQALDEVIRLDKDLLVKQELRGKLLDQVDVDSQEIAVLQKQIEENRQRIEREEQLRAAMDVIQNNPERTESDINEMIEQLHIVVEDHQGAETVLTKVVTTGKTTDGTKLVKVTYVDEQQNEYIVSKRVNVDPGERQEDHIVHDQLLFDVCLLLCAMSVGGVVAELLGQPHPVGYSLGGALIGPFGAGYITQLIQVYTLTEIASAIVTFNLGLEADFHFLSKRRVVLVGVVVGEFLVAILVAMWIAPAYVFHGATLVGTLLTASTFYISASDVSESPSSSPSSSSSPPSSSGVLGAALGTPGKQLRSPVGNQNEAILQSLFRVMHQMNVMFSLLAMLFIDGVVVVQTDPQDDDGDSDLSAVIMQFIGSLCKVAMVLIPFLVVWHTLLHMWLRWFQLTRDQFMCLSLLASAALMSICSSISHSGTHVGAFFAGGLISVKGFQMGRDLMARLFTSYASTSTAWMGLKRSYKNSDEDLSKTTSHPVAEARTAESEVKQLHRMTGQLVDGVVSISEMVCALSYTATGMFIDVALLLDQWQDLLWSVAVMMAIKGMVSFVLARLSGACSTRAALRYALLAMPASEYAFIICHTSVFSGIITLEHHKSLSLMVLLSIMVSPFFAKLSKRIPP